MTRAASSVEKRLKVLPPGSNNRLYEKAAREPGLKGAVFSPRLLELGFEFDQSLESFEKIPKGAGRKHDRITPPTHVFSDFQKPSSLIFFEVKKKNLPVNGDFFGRNWVRSHSFPWILVHHIQTITDISAQCQTLACDEGLYGMRKKVRRNGEDSGI
jgi:hypothetical protein